MIEPLSGFCPQKWHDLLVWPSIGRVAACCHTPQKKITVGELSTIGAHRFNNTDEIIAERKDMLAGKKLSQCDFCWQVESKGGPGKSLRQLAIERSDIIMHQYSESVESAIPDSVTVILDTVCNLTCLYCGPDQSTAWAALLKKSAIPSSLGGGKYSEKNNLVRLIPVKQINKSPYYNKLLEWMQDSDFGKVKSVTISGGEPLLSPQFWEFIALLDTSKSITVNTNLCVPVESLERLARMCPTATIRTSVESVGQRAEYIRRGLKWDTWLTNLQYACDNFPKVVITSTANIYATVMYAEFLDWFVSFRAQHKNISLSPVWVTTPEFLTSSVLPDHLRNYACQKIISWLDSKPGLLTSTETARVLSFVDSISSNGSDNNCDNIAKFLEFNKYIESTSSLKLTNIFPELALWYNSLND